MSLYTRSFLAFLSQSMAGKRYFKGVPVLAKGLNERLAWRRGRIAVCTVVINDEPSCLSLLLKELIVVSAVLAGFRQVVLLASVPDFLCRAVAVSPWRRLDRNNGAGQLILKVKAIQQVEEVFKLADDFRKSKKLVLNFHIGLFLFGMYSSASEVSVSF